MDYRLGFDFKVYDSFYWFDSTKNNKNNKTSNRGKNKNRLQGNA